MHGAARRRGDAVLLVDLDGTKAQTLKGVQVVRDGDFAGIVAPDAYTAERAIEALAKDAKWSETPAQPSNATIFEYLKQNAETSTEERAQPRTRGDIAQAMASAEVTLSRTYTLEYIAHAPLTRKEHWIGWLREYHGPGAYGRRAATTRRSAEFAYNHIVESKMLVWLVEAAGVTPSCLVAARRSAARAKSMAAKSAALRRHSPGH